jgi:hypothetical protein
MIEIELRDIFLSIRSKGITRVQAIVNLSHNIKLTPPQQKSLLQIQTKLYQIEISVHLSINSR